MIVNTKNCSPGCIFQIWPLFDLFWPPVASTDLWDQNSLVYVSKWKHMCMYSENCIPGGILKNYPYFDLCWPPMTFNELWGQNNISSNNHQYHVIMYAKNCSPGYIFLYWPHFDLCIDPQWPLMPYEVKITHPMILKWLIWVCPINIGFLVEKLGPWLHFSFLTSLTLWPIVTFNFLWGQDDIVN